MATYTVSALAGGGGDGSVGDPFTWDEAAVHTGAIGDIYDILADGTHSANVTWNLDSIGVVAKLIKGPSNANKAVVQWNGAATQMMLPENYCHLQHIDFDGNSTATYGVFGSRNYSAYQCIFRGTTLRGAQMTGNAGLLYQCAAIGNSGFGFEFRGTVYECVATGNGSSAFYNTLGKHIGCIAYGNTADGFGNVQDAHRCISYNNGGDGFDGISSQPIRWTECIAVDNAGYGFNVDATSNDECAFLLNCYGYNNTSGLYFLQTSGGGVNVGVDPIALTADPFENAASQDFNLNDAAGGGRVLRALETAFPGISTAAWPFNMWADADTIAPAEADVRDGTFYGVNAAREGTLAADTVDVFGGDVKAAADLVAKLQAESGAVLL